MPSPFACLLAGFRLALQPGLRHWVLLPLAANTLLFGMAVWWLYGLAAGVLASAGLAGEAAASGWLAGALNFIVGLARLLLLALLLLAAAWAFTAVLHLLTAPLNGLLAERAWERHTGRAIPDVPFARMAVRSIRRTVRALRYWALRALGLGLLSLAIGWVPLLNATVPVLWFLFGAWMTAVTYFDYPADNLGVDFETMLARLHRERMTVLALGAAVFALTLVPVVNFVIMPAAVCAATIMWAEYFDLPPPGARTSPASR